MGTQIEEHRKRISELKVTLSNRKRIAELEERISELDEQAQSCAIAKAKYERMQYQLMQYQRLKAETLQNAVNSMFTFVKFSLFTTTIEGNIIEGCTPMINGVPYESANSAAKLNAGLDIINTLSKAYGYEAPIWIDNAEGINNILPTDSQQIRLIVSDGELLIS